MTKAEIQQFVYDFLYEKGLPHNSICAVMGNITAESSWDPDAIEYGNNIGFGLCQWSFGRRTQLEAYGTTIRHQCEFLWSELTGEGLMITGADYQWFEVPGPNVDNGEGFVFSNEDFRAGNGSVALLTKAFCYCWERPAWTDWNIPEVRIPAAEEFARTMSYKNSGVPDLPTTKKNMSKLLLYYGGTHRR